MGKMIVNQTVKITDTGNFNTLVKHWYSVGGTNDSVELQLEVGEIVNIKSFQDPTVPGGVYSHITKTSKHYTNVLGVLIQDRNSPDYDMKKDRHRIQVTSKLN
ncbi:conserved domain protein [Vibrio phage KVP40]|uniref:Conserved domain protein n=2 Tax=Schizotequatrovirus KVP40 TaxID=1914019 RepID=Q6WHL0_BPKVM|nr:hypothetical protein KVP40.0293 [Vibrio phage KVP40]AAQ64363.1 conserved domain protein [Vibrio phage KVP40]QHJ74472.1 hypothetical protein VH12019_00145 [Vibrio phage VH1_2019]WOL24825.1 hypothetical protein [Vibrio phage PG216]